MKRQFLALTLLAALSVTGCASVTGKLSTVNKDINAITCGAPGAPPAPACLEGSQSATLLGDSATLSNAVTAERQSRTLQTIAGVASAVLTFFADAGTFVKVDITTIVNDIKAVLAGL